MGIKENIHRAKHSPIVGAQEFFDRHNMRTVEYVKPSGLKRAKTYFFNILLFFIVSILLGVLVSLIPLSMFSAGAIASEPIAEKWKSLPSELDTVTIAERNVMYDNDGKKFAEVWAENRISLPNLDSISDYAIKALIATEDKRFYDHAGFDVIGTARSALKASGGGSGITQQLVKNLQFYNQAGKDKKDEAVEATLERKIKELKLSLNYEKTHTKDEILLEYFNTVSFGAPNIYSIEAASQYFFGKKAKDLSLAEASALVGSVQNTAIFNMDNKESKEKWQARQKIVLTRMLDEKYITSDEYNKALNEKLSFKKKMPNGNCTSSKFPFYCEYVLDYMKENPRLGDTPEERQAIMAKGGLHINTYLDRDELKLVEKTLKENFGNNNRVVSPVAIVEPGTGGVTSIGVNRKYGSGKGKTQFIVSDLESGTGSTYKMITLAAALANGFTEKDLTFSSQCPWRNPNYDTPPGGVKNSASCKLQGGLLDYKKATAYSSNTWFTELITKVGVENTKNFSEQLNLNAPDFITSRSVSYTLGTTSNSTINMAAAFATFANEGVFCPATPVKDFAYSDGSVPVLPDSYNPETNACKSVMSPKEASIVLKAMRANVSGEIENAFGLEGRIKGYDAVGKTGTNQLYNLTWAQLSANKSLFINIHDMEKLTNGVEYVTYKGYPRIWRKSAAMDSGVEIMTQVLKNNPKEKLDFNNKNETKKYVHVDTRDFVNVPNVKGMDISSALGLLESIGIKTNVLKEQQKIDKNDRIPENIVISQSIEPGTQLAIGTETTIELKTSVRQ